MPPKLLTTVYRMNMYLQAWKKK